MQISLFSAWISYLFGSPFHIPEQQRDAPDTCKGNQRIDHTADGSTLTAEKPCHCVKLKQADAAPVERADDHQDQCDSVQHSHHNSFLPRFGKHIIALSIRCLIAVWLLFVKDMHAGEHFSLFFVFASLILYVTIKPESILQIKEVL